MSYNDSLSINNIISTESASATNTLERDENGYYKINLGGFNIFNHKNEFYRVKDLNALLNNKNSVFYKRLHNGYLLGEAEHPKMKPGMTSSEYYFRNLTIQLDNTSHHIRPEIELRDINEPVKIPGAGRPVRVLGWIKPSGKHGAALQSMLDNPHQNVAFSIRAITTPPTNIGGYVVKDVIEIITWDWVDVPGITAANKWSTIAKESYDYGHDVLIEDIIVDAKSNTTISTESDIQALHKDIINKVQFENKISNVNPILGW